ncbi:Na+/H+ antiporter subunit D [Agrobacterium vitis]|uniref:Na+/H+ antiporter subunit D n=1 Tax=Agrobacterium vitis TaxID=373 RepID=A0AAE4WFZ4_AGRVI|nr:Na+/H+ antiporter subunit D [Agrobacterium vitis]MCF1500406.1 Na+/H+ antiporter subunit D [Allorhizobium sp. Av2]MCM2442700.1 Na+/H+ antiporter subunit D [Agrobacterium vitis]MUZ60341.1 Na+/H+ antiporter subunit D [Agrobacterium vitis]MVA68422.1 Na+/H+ antiporter subunit D [Agrobacterium vitis]MVA88852.1 Na+/H+ antiporter subunit D [Agrobacterium vitis]
MAVSPTNTEALTAALAAATVQTPTTFAQWLPILPVALCLAGGAVALMLRDRTRLQPMIALPTLVLLVLIDLALLLEVIKDGPLTVMMGRWLPPFGIAFTVDITGALFALISAIVALACGVYGLTDINTSGRRYGFYPFLLVLMAGVSGAFLTGDIFNLYVWFEVLLISSFGMLILGSEREQIDGALKYAVLNLIATTLFLITIGFLYASFGTLNMADIARKADGLRDTAPLMTLATLFALAFAMKAAAFPLNFWLPASYHTPRIVVSALFAALLTKVGIYSLLRVVVMLFPIEREQLSLVLGVIAAATMVLGAVGALGQSDIRRLMGFVVISGIGIMLAGIAIGAVQGISATIFYAMHSILLMAALYLVVGQAGRMTGSFALQDMSGLYRAAPGFSFLALALFFAASGLPPFSGFWPKVMLLKAALDIGAWWMAGAILLSGFLTTIALARVFLLAFWRTQPARDESDVNSNQANPGILTAPTRSSLAPILLLAGLIVWFGLFPETLIALSQDAAVGLVDPSAYITSVFPTEARP